MSRGLRSTLGSLWAHASTHPLWSALLAALLAVAVLSLGSLAGRSFSGDEREALPTAGWGPDRPLYWCKQPRSCDGADRVTFNSYANAPNYGFEPAFADAKPNTIRGPGHFEDVLGVEPGETILLRIYVNNSAWAGRLGGRSGIAVGTRARFEVPLEASARHEVYGYVSARNAEPETVWDGITLRSEEPTILRFVFGSGRWLTKPIGEVPLSDALVEEGTAIGSWALDGRFGDDFVDSGLLTALVRVQAAVGG